MPTPEMCDFFIKFSADNNKKWVSILILWTDTHFILKSSSKPLVWTSLSMVFWPIFNYTSFRSVFRLVSPDWSDWSVQLFALLLSRHKRLLWLLLSLPFVRLLPLLLWNPFSVFLRSITFLLLYFSFQTSASLTSCLALKDILSRWILCFSGFGSASLQKELHSWKEKVFSDFPSAWTYLPF